MSRRSRQRRPARAAPAPLAVPLSAAARRSRPCWTRRSRRRRPGRLARSRWRRIRQADRAARALGRARARPRLPRRQRDAAAATGAASATREALQRARASAQALLDAASRAERPLAILSDNDIEHALLALGAMLRRHPLRAGLAGLFARSRRTTASCATSSAC